MEASDSFLIPVGDSIAGISIGNERKNSIIVTCKNTGIKVYEVIIVLPQKIKKHEIKLRLSIRCLINNVLRIGQHQQH